MSARRQNKLQQNFVQYSNTVTLCCFFFEILILMKFHGFAKIGHVKRIVECKILNLRYK